jgi:hypothetical protein
VTADAGPGLDSPAREREMLADGLSDACAIVLVELPPETPLYAFGGGADRLQDARGAFERNSNDWQPLERMG